MIGNLLSSYHVYVEEEVGDFWPTFLGLILTSTSASSLQRRSCHLYRSRHFARWQRKHQRTSQTDFSTQ